jgi:hypothetical protein
LRANSRSVGCRAANSSSVTARASDVGGWWRAAAEQMVPRRRLRGEPDSRPLICGCKAPARAWRER